MVTVITMGSNTLDGYSYSYEQHQFRRLQLLRRVAPGLVAELITTSGIRLDVSVTAHTTADCLLQNLLLHGIIGTMTENHSYL